MTCGELEILLCDYLDGGLDGEAARGVEAHLETCAACAELARDSRAATAFFERVADVEPPPQLLARILTETASGRHGRLGGARGIGGWFENLLAPVLQPRLVMGMALTVVSFTMMARCAGVSPRHHSVPSSRTPHGARPPASKRVQVPSSANGAVTSAGASGPPQRLSPQQRTSPAAVRAQV